MYLSQYFTCEEIDERLLQGYYDDLVEAGFVGTIQEFWAFILSIADKVDKVDGYSLSKNDFTDELKEKLDNIEEYANYITKVSELENDSDYQTGEQVEAAIAALVDGASDALDTLKELAEALDNDPNFATTITNKITEVRNELLDEITRATEAEADLSNNIEQVKSDILASIQELISQFDITAEELQTQITNLETKVENDIANLASYKTEMATTIEEVRTEAKDYTDAETTRSMEVEADLQDQIRELTNTHTTDLASVNAAIENEVAARQSADTTLQTNIDTEAATRAAEDEAIRAEFAAADEAIKNNSVQWVNVATSDLPNRKAIVLPTLGDIILGTDADGNTRALLQLNRWGVVDVGNAGYPINLNTPDGVRPTVQEASQTGEQAHSLAYLSDIQQWFGSIELPEEYQQTCYVIPIPSLTQDFIDTHGNPEYINGTVFDSDTNSYILGRPYLAVAYQDIGLVTHYSLYTANNSAYIGSIFYAMVELAKQDEDNLAEVKQSIQDVINDNAIDRSDLEALIQEEAEARAEADNVLDEAKVDKVEGYGLSQNDFTDTLLEKLNSIEDYANYVSNISELVNDVGYQTADEVTAAINNLIGAAPGVLDTLEEIAAALGDDPNFATTITKKLAALAEDINTEAEAREASDNTLQTNIDNLGTTVDTKLAALQTDLQNQINTEITERQNADSNLQALISSEASERQNADSNLQAQITQELSDRQAADQALQSQITDLATQLGQAGSNLKDYIDTLIANLQTQISSNTSLINTNTSNIQRNLELIQGLQSQVNSINELITQVNELINTEISERKAADEVLQSNIDKVSADLVTEAATREAADQVLQNNIDALESDLIQKLDTLEAKHDSDIEAEETARKEADQFIQDQIDTFPDNIRVDESLSQTATAVVINHTYKSKDADQKYTVEGTNPITIPAATSTTAGVMSATDKGNLDQVQVDLVNEVTNRQSADAILQSNIEAEASARGDADTALQIQITANTALIEALSIRVDTLVSTLESMQSTIEAQQVKIDELIEALTLKS